MIYKSESQGWKKFTCIWDRAWYNILQLLVSIWQKQIVYSTGIWTSLFEITVFTLRYEQWYESEADKSIFSYFTGDQKTNFQFYVTRLFKIAPQFWSKYIIFSAMFAFWDAIFLLKWHGSPQWKNTRTSIHLCFFKNIRVVNILKICYKSKMLR